MYVDGAFGEGTFTAAGQTPTTTLLRSFCCSAATFKHQLKTFYTLMILSNIAGRHCCSSAAFVALILKV